MNRLFAGLAMALLVVAVVAVHLWLEVGKQRESNTALAARISALESVRSGAVAQEVARPVASGGAAAIGPAPAGAGNDRAAAATGEAALLAGMREMLETESGRELIASFGVMALRRQYPDLEKAMGLTPEEADKLLELLARQRVDSGLPPGVGRSRPEADPAAREHQERALAEQRERESAGEAQIAALLGDRYPKWQEYERMSAERMGETYTREARAQLRAAISSRDNPMADATFEAFTAAVDAEERRFQQESPPRSVQQQVQQLPEMHRRMIQAASAHLDAAQLERYRQYLAEQANMMSGVMLMIDDE
jgi:hypothetical protein